MTRFIEFNYSGDEKISVNVARITNIFPAGRMNAKICMGDEDSFTVAHTYEEVKTMLSNMGDVMFYALKP